MIFLAECKKFVIKMLFSCKFICHSWSCVYTVMNDVVQIMSYKNICIQVIYYFHSASFDFLINVKCRKIDVFRQSLCLIFYIFLLVLVSYTQVSQSFNMVSYNLCLSPDDIIPGNNSFTSV